MAGSRGFTHERLQPPVELPFTLAEYADRLRRIRERMARDRIDILFLSAPESMCYASGFACEWYQAQSPKAWPATSGIAVHVDRDDFIHFDTPSEAPLVRQASCARDIRIFPIAERRDGIGFIIDELKASGWMKDGSTVGLEFWSYRPNRAVSQRFEARLIEAGCKVVDGSDVLRAVRWHKSPQEIAMVEQAGRIADAGIAAVRRILRAGMTELEVYGEMVAAMTKAGGENPGITQPVVSGHRANCGHALATRKVILPGEVVGIDVCGVYNRYHANMARLFSVGEPAKDVVDFHARAAGVFPVIRDILRPNLPVAELNRAARAYYEDVGIWREGHWLGGYEMGIAFPPDWVGNFVYEYHDTATAEVFMPGAAVNFESVFFMPRMTGTTWLIDTIVFRWEDATLLSREPYDLCIV